MKIEFHTWLVGIYFKIKFCDLTVSCSNKATAQLNYQDRN